MFQQNSLEDIRHVLAAVGACFQAFINLLPLDQHDGILLILEQSRDDVPGDPIRFVLQAVDRDKSRIQILDLAELRDAPSQFLAGVINDIDQRDRFLGGLSILNTTRASAAASMKSSTSSMQLASA